MRAGSESLGPGPEVPVAIGGGWPASLPAQPTRLLGRERELEVVRAYLRNEWVRLVTLTGCAGVGKTRLAVQVAAELYCAFRGGVVFVDLACAGKRPAVTPEIARALGVGDGERSLRVDRVAGALRERDALVVLDGLERALEAGVLLGQLLAACPAAKVLATSRCALRLRWELEVPVAPLALPDVPEPDHAYDVASATRSPAVALFCARARAVRPGFCLTPENALAVVELCRRLDGLPLAIELAAARARSMTPEAMLERIAGASGGSPLALLSGGLRDLPRRQRSLRDAIAWSHARLSDAERALFARLAVFAGGCTLEAADEVCGVASCEFRVLSWEVGNSERAARESELDVLPTLDSLVAQSLVCAETGAHPPRFRVLHTIRDYALERLAERGELEAFRRRHAAYYLALAERAAAHSQSCEQAEWLDRLEAEHENLREALHWALDGGAPGGPQLGVRLVRALCPFWQARGQAAEGRSWLARLAAAAPAYVTEELRRRLEGKSAPRLLGAAHPRLLPAPETSPGTGGEPRPQELLGRLSERELVVLRLVAAGKSNREIAAGLVLSERTVAHHLTSIFNKLGVRSRTAAAALALRAGVS